MCLGVTMMEWQHSLTPQAMVFHINPGKPRCLQFLIVVQSDIMLYRVVMGLLMNLHRKILQCRLWIWILITRTRPCSSSQKANIIGRW